MSKISWIFIFSLFLPISCGKDDPVKENSPEIHFDITGRLLEGKKINCIETDSSGNIWIASDKELYYKNGSEEKTYTLDFSIPGLAIASDESL
jgi:ligand-binding sensor domain-containing protein